MSGKLIVLTGVHRIIGMANPASVKFSDEVSYFPSISDDLNQRGAPRHWESCPFFDELVMRQEMERDAVILPLLRKERAIVFVEQWHIGNIAWARARSSDIANEYETRLNNLLQQFQGIETEVWYISTDLEKIISPELRMAYKIYLQELSALANHFRFHEQNLDGDAPPDLIEKRIEYLLSES